MRVNLLSSSVELTKYQFGASYIVNDTFVVDAGAIGFADMARQRAVRAVVLSHSHLDHVASLPIFIDNVHQPGLDCPTVYASQTVIDALKTHFFNELIWPDVIRLSREESAFVRFVAIEHRRPVEIEKLTVTPVALDHVVPTFGFVVDDGDSAVAFVSDTAPTAEIWEVVRSNHRLKAVFLECAFPNRMAWLAAKAKHLTPDLLRQEYAKLGSELPVIVIHVKPAFYDTVAAELCDLRLKTLVIGEPNSTYVY
jgi:cAMP phosphodiesterase